jgi:hypothetical protein
MLIGNYAGWAIANSATTFKSVYDGNEGYRDDVNTDPEVNGWPEGELAEALNQPIPAEYISINP